MLNLDETLFANTGYTKQRDIYIRILLFAGGVVAFVEYLRGQVSEVNLLQLIPGFYLLLLYLDPSCLMIKMICLIVLCK